MRAEDKLMIFNLSGAKDLIDTAARLGARDTEKISDDIQNMIKAEISALPLKEARNLVKAAHEYTYEVKRKKINSNAKYTVVGLDNLTKIINECLKYKCMGCDLSKIEASRCWFRKAMEEEGYESVSSWFDNCPYNL